MQFVARRPAIHASGKVFLHRLAPEGQLRQLCGGRLGAASTLRSPDRAWCEGWDRGRAQLPRRLPAAWPRVRWSPSVVLTQRASRCRSIGVSLHLSPRRAASGLLGRWNFRHDPLVHAGSGRSLPAVPSACPYRRAKTVTNGQPRFTGYRPDLAVWSPSRTSP